jgi:hypothetical protein
MPTILRDGPYRFFFYANEDGEPVHIHVEHGRATAKFWLAPVSLARSRQFAPHELVRIEALVRHHRPRLLEAWHDFFRH